MKTELEINSKKELIQTLNDWQKYLLKKYHFNYHKPKNYKSYTLLTTTNFWSNREEPHLEEVLSLLYKYSNDCEDRDYIISKSLEYLNTTTNDNAKDNILYFFWVTGSYKFYQYYFRKNYNYFDNQMINTELSKQKGRDNTFNQNYKIYLDFDKTNNKNIKKFIKFVWFIGMCVED